MTAAQHLHDADWALEILSDAKAKKRGSMTAHLIAVLVLAETGRLEEARDTLQVNPNGYRAWVGVFSDWLEYLPIPRSLSPTGQPTHRLDTFSLRPL